MSHDLPLDAAALDLLYDSLRWLPEKERSRFAPLIAQARAELPLREALSACERERDGWRNGQQQMTALFDDLWKSSNGWIAHANALREALESARGFIATAQSADAFHDWATDTERGGLDVHAELVRCNAALLATPAASLAAHDAEVLERLPSGKSLHDWMRNRGWVVTMPEADELARAIRALAAQEVKP